MKKVQQLILGITLFLIGTVSLSAQVRININLQPLWGPTEYDYVEYYYLPEHDIYYYAPQRQFIYLRGGNWTTVRSLPTQYRNVDLYNTYKVVINEPKPYLKHKYYADHYKQFKGQHSKQTIIRDSKDAKYAKHNGHVTQSTEERGVKAQQRKQQVHANKSGNAGQQNKGKGNKKH